MFKIRAIGNPYEAIQIASQYAPYIMRLIEKCPETFQELKIENPKRIIDDIFCDVENSVNLELNNAMRELRLAKARTHLVLTAADLSQTMNLMEITHALSKLADLSLNAALKLAIKDAPDRDKNAFIDNQVPGLFIIAMGKHGAGELNYSSDIDLAAFFDREAFHEDYHYSATAICVRIIGSVSRILEEITADNYVFRVDWRLRPDPASTPLAVSTQSAEVYYESVGQNWERAAFIKARPICGAKERADIFLNDLQPFIWRKYLDFAAVLDVGSILRQIHRVNKSGSLNEPSFDVKLGRGGIREIEFFTQTQQLILGGKDKNLREKRTIDALKALNIAQRIDKNICDELINCYEFLRNIEHRIQMLEDEQTHVLPSNIEKRSRVAILCGYDDLNEFDAIVKSCREMVGTNIQGLFPQTESLSDISGSLVFTGVEDDEETLETLGAMGFKDAKRVSQTIRGWHHGRIRATRTPRAREILTAITPQLLNSISQTGEADIVFARFDDFFSGMSAGVQTLALFQTEKHILNETCLTLGLSSRLAQDLAKKPAILDAMLSPRFIEPLGHTSYDDLKNIAKSALENCKEFEFALDIIRRFKREEAFRIGFHILHGRAKSDVAGLAYSNLARVCIDCLLEWAIKEVENSHGKFDGSIAVCAWGKFGANELAADSDLDLIVIYEPNEGADFSNGARALSAESYFAKITQKLIMALSIATSEGELYEVDMQLRPSGKKGPVAVRFSSFENYYKTEAWTWEFQALTRLVPICGDIKLCEKIKETKISHLTSLDDKNKIIKDIIEMRNKIKENIKSRGDWDLKRVDGGIIDLEFYIQALQLINAKHHPQIIDANTLNSLKKIGQAEILGLEETSRLYNAGLALNKVRQILAIVAGPEFDPIIATNATKMAIANNLEQPNFSMAQAVLNDARIEISNHWLSLEKMCN